MKFNLILSEQIIASFIDQLKMEYKKKRFWQAHALNKNTDNTNQIDTTKLETEDEKTARIRSLWVINIQTFIFALSFSIVITGVLPYLRQVRYIVPKFK